MRKAILIFGLLVRLTAFLFLAIAVFIAWRAIPIEKSIKADADEAHRVLLEAGLTATEARKASADERQYLHNEVPHIAANVEKILHDSDNLMLRLNRSVGNLDSVAHSATETLSQASSALEGVRPVLDAAKIDLMGLQPIEDEATLTIADTDALVRNPDIPQTLKNINEGSTEIAATAKDVREKVHAITHPKPLDRVIGWVLKAGEVTRAWFGGLL